MNGTITFVFFYAFAFSKKITSKSVFVVALNQGSEVLILNNNRWASSQKCLTTSYLLASKALFASFGYLHSNYVEYESVCWHVVTLVRHASRRKVYAFSVLPLRLLAPEHHGRVERLLCRYVFLSWSRKRNLRDLLRTFDNLLNGYDGVMCFLRWVRCLCQYMWGRERKSLRVLSNAARERYPNLVRNKISHGYE